jgi:Zn-dependent metalloprotease
MHRLLRRVLPRPALLALIGALATAHGPSAMNTAPSAQVARAQSALVAMRSSLGLGDADAFRLRSTLVNEQGVTVARFDQEHGGYRVWGGEAIAHARPSGEVKTFSRGLLRQISVAGEPRLTPDQALRIALRELRPQGPFAMQPRVERIVFPSRFTGGLARRWDPALRRFQVDRAMSVLARPPSTPYVWAYEVGTVLHNRADGHRETTLIVDGNTGSILRKSNDVRTAAAVGTGHGFYNPSVQLGTTRNADRTYSMVDTTRGTLPNPWLTGTGPFDPPANGYTGPTKGLMTFYQDNANTTLGFSLYAGNRVDTWGDGQPYAGSFIGDWHDFVLSLTEGTPNGQTPAVDAQYGVSVTWDFYKNVFGRNGVDGLGTSTFTFNHELDPLFGGPLANASWSDNLFGMFYGDGDYPYNPNGFQETAAIDVTGHEMTHGVTGSTSQLYYQGESGGLNEASSDIMGEMVEAYSKRPAGTDTVVPEGNDFLVGAGPGRGTPLRWMTKPSKDGLSEDQWYDGLGLHEVHFSSGPMNRCFYFLSHGASADKTDDGYSPYLPGGMTGIGNDKAARIYYKALTEYFTSTTDYPAAREALLRATEDLFPGSQTEADAVKSAFAAINVGQAPGQAPRPLVRMPPIHDGTYLGYVNDHFFSFNDFARSPVYPLGVPVHLKATVENSANTEVEWLTHGRTPLQTCGGTLRADGMFVTPTKDYALSGDDCWVTAVSKADPLEFAVGTLFIINLDADDDLQEDAMDLGASALSWGLPHALTQSHSMTFNYAVDNTDPAFAVEAIRNAYPADAAVAP